MKSSPLASALGETKQDALMRALEREAGNITRAAKALGIARQHATRLVKLYQIGEFAAQLREAAGSRRVTDGPDKGKVKGHPVVKPKKEPSI